MTKSRSKKGKTSGDTGRRRGTSSPLPVSPNAGVAARFAGTCVTCRRGYPVNAPLGKVEDGWAHAACAEAVRERGRILRGETFAGQKPSDWRLGKGPSSTRITR
ncbi:hypothetical protein ABZ793_28880 [Micromonospora sp. NPDC047465]|uniref:hypothetical protein n=1 Tax=Micromonospora sp. NPDC047465 TaxID=3154813 RepID=UPI003403FCE7